MMAIAIAIVACAWAQNKFPDGYLNNDTTRGIIIQNGQKTLRK